MWHYVGFLQNTEYRKEVLANGYSGTEERRLYNLIREKGRSLVLECPGDSLGDQFDKVFVKM